MTQLIGSCEIHKNTRNSVEILSNTCLYNIFETYLSYWGYLLTVNLQIYLDTSSLKRANNVPKLPVNYVVKNWALAMMLRALPLVHFWNVLFLKEQLMTSVRKTLKTLVRSAIGSFLKRIVVERAIDDLCKKNVKNAGPIGPKLIDIWQNFPSKITTKSAFFYRLIFGKVCPKHSLKSAAKSADFSANLPLKIPRNLTFFHPLSGPGCSNVG